MAIPGSNLLKQARKVIKFTNIQYMKFGNRILDSNRNWVNDFFPAVPLSASVQDGWASALAIKIKGNP